MIKDSPVSSLSRRSINKRWVFLLGLLLMSRFTFSQTTLEDSLLIILSNPLQDTNRVMALIRLGDLYRFARPQEAVAMMQDAKDLAVKLNFKKGEIQVLNLLGESARVNGEYTKSLEIQLKALEMSKTLKNASTEANSLTYIGLTYTEIGDYRPGLNFLNQAFALHDKLNMVVNGSFDLSNIGYTYEKLGLLDSALFFQLKAREYLKQFYHIALESLILTRLGQLKLLMGHPRDALALGNEALNRALRTGDMRNQSGALFRIAEAYYAMDQPDSSLYFARKGLALSQQFVQRNISLDLYNLLTKIHLDKNRLDSAFYYQKLSISVKDSLFGPQKIKELQLVTFNEFQRQQKSEAERLMHKNRVKIYSLLALVLTFSGMGIVLYRNYVQKQEANTILAKTLIDLQATQSQLIQSEKMASLGELTAGIAHEIQNPLNFVNNFAEINKELLDEIQEERRKPARPDSFQETVSDGEKGERNDRLVSELFNTVRENEEKIHQHGKRADAIVKGMLQHSQKQVGVKEPTNINALSEEYLRLAYHGFQAKNPNFFAELKIELDPTLPIVNVIPQDIGRVLLNIYNNAFWFLSEALAKDRACASKSKGDSESPLDLKDYTPTVIISTKNKSDKVEIRVKDNGPGIPPHVVDKIFQPFFTTKPTGQGTGLGLSLAYDIIKAHQGELKVVTIDESNLPAASSVLNEQRTKSDVTTGSEFIIEIPIN